MSAVLHLDQFRDDFVDAASDGLNVFLQAVTAKAKAKAPVRKIFHERGAKRFETRTFRDASGKVTQTTVMTSRYTRMSTTKAARRAFFPRMDFKNPHAYRGGTLVAGEGRRGVEVQYALYDQLTSRGKYELRRGMRAYGSRAGGEGDTTVIRVKNTLAALRALGMSQAQAAAYTPYQKGEKFEHHYLLQLGGKLRASIENHTEEDGNTLRGYVYTEVPYSMPQEFGTRHHSAHPFMRPALYEEERRMETLVAGRVRRVFGG